MSALYFLTGFESKKLEQMVEENDFINKGKTVDALMMIRGIISSLCFVEIKTHETKLLDSNSYRAACWVASKELIGAIAQIQETVSIASKIYMIE